MKISLLFCCLFLSAIGDSCISGEVIHPSEGGRECRFVDRYNKVILHVRVSDETGTCDVLYRDTIKTGPCDTLVFAGGGEMERVTPKVDGSDPEFKGTAASQKFGIKDLLPYVIRK